MKRSEIRNKMDSAIDEVESTVGDILDYLKRAEDIAIKDSEDIDKSEIEQMQDTIIESIKWLQELKDALW